MRTLGRTVRLGVCLVLAIGFLLIGGPNQGAIAQGVPAILVISDGRGAPDTLNPFQSSFGPDYPVFNLLFTPLVNWDAHGQAFSDILSSTPTFANHGAIHVGSDLQVTYRLREGLKWSDGQSITSDDIVLSWGLWLYNSIVPPYKLITAPDPLTAVVLYQGTPPGYLESTSFLVPKHVWNTVDNAVAKLVNDPTTTFEDPGAVTSGPYIVDSFDHNGSLNLKPNPNYEGGRPSLPPIEFKWISKAELVALVVGKNVDAASNLNPADVPSLMANPNLSVSVQPGAGFDDLIFNTMNSPFDNSAVRHAFASAIDRASFCQILLRGLKQLCGTYIPNSSISFPFYTPIRVSPVPFDPDAAAAAARQLGVNGHTFNLLTTMSDAHRQEATMIKNALVGLGVTVNIEALPAIQLYNPSGPVFTGKFDIALVTLPTVRDPALALQQYTTAQIPSATYPFGLNLGRYSNSTFDSMVQGAEKTFNPASRETKLNAALQFKIDNAVDLPLLSTPSVTAYDHNIVNFTPNVTGITWNAAQWGSATRGDAVLPPPDTSGNDINTLWSASNAIDGLPGSTFETPPEQTSNQYIILGFKNNELGNVSRIAIDPSAGNAHAVSEAVKDFGVEISTTGTAPADFTSVFTGSTTPVAGAQYFSLKNTMPVRYIKFDFVNNNGDTNFISVNNVQAIGRLASDPKATANLARLQHDLVAHSHAGASALGAVRAIIKGLSVTRSHKKPLKGKVRMTLFGSDFLRTLKSQRASLAFKDGSVLNMNQLTDAVLTATNNTLVKKGEVDQVVTPGTDHQVTTAAATAAAIGTNFDVKVAGSTTQIVVVEGVVKVSNPQGTVYVKTGQQTSVTVGQSPAAPTPADSAATTSWTARIPPAYLPYNLALDFNGGHVVATSP